MQVLNLLQQNNITQIPFLGKELGFGADGQVFELADDPYRVIKLSVCFDEEKTYEDVEEILQYLLQYQPLSYATVYEATYLGHYNRQIIRGNTSVLQNYFLYFYVLEKLYKISEDEKKIFHSIISHEDKNITKNYPLSKVKEMLDGMSYSLDFDYNKVLFFYQHLQNCPLKHLDLHVRNIMKDGNGNFKMTDFDRMKL